MGEKNNAEATLYYFNGDRFEKIEGIKEFPVFQPEDIETAETDHLFTINGIDLSGVLGETGWNKPCGFNVGRATFSIKRPKSLRCNGRKRFIKLLMSKGIPRNMAVTMANCKPENESYDFMWFWIRLMCVGGF